MAIDFRVGLLRVMSKAAALQDEIFRKWLSDNGAIYPKIKFRRSFGGMEASHGNVLVESMFVPVP